MSFHLTISADKWRAILDDLKDRMSLVSDNSAYTVMDAVLQVFRRRLTAQQGLDFASVLPSIPRAVFVSGWQLDVPPPPFASRETLIDEVKKIRQHHNLAPATAIEATAWSLRHYTNKIDLERVLAQPLEGAVQFWHVDVADPREIEQRFF